MKKYLKALSALLCMVLLSCALPTVVSGEGLTDQGLVVIESEHNGLESIEPDSLAVGDKNPVEGISDMDLGLGALSLESEMLPGEDVLPNEEQTDEDSDAEVNGAEFSDVKHASSSGVKTVHSLVICSRDTFHEAKTASDAMYAALSRNCYPGYANITEKLFYNADQKAEKRGINYLEMNDALDGAFSSSSKSDINVIYYSGHTVKDASGTLGIKLAKDLSYDYETFARRLSQYKGSFVVIMDTCFAEGFYSQGVLSLKKGLRSRFTCMLSNVITDETFGAKYTTSLMTGIGFSKLTFPYRNTGWKYGSQAADSNADGVITVAEAHEYGIKQAAKKAKNKYVPLYGDLGNFPLFQHANIKANKPSVEIWTGEKAVTVKNVVTAQRNPKTTERDILWESSDDSILSVQNCYSTVNTNNYALVLNPHKAGKVTLTGALAWNKGTGALVKCWDTTEVRIKVTVKKPSIKLDATKLTMTAGKHTLTATVKGPSQKVTWKSSNTAVASVSQKGVVTAKKAGKATITASANGVSAKCKVTVDGFDGGIGTEANPFRVRTLRQFLLIPDFSGCCFKQIANIDGGGADFQPLGNFEGSYDGGGYTIRNLTVTGAGSVGLFETISSDSKIQNLKLSGIEAVSTGSECGTLAGKNFGTISRCSVSGSSAKATGTSQTSVGGLVGHNSGGLISECSVSNVTVKGNDAGGIAGGMSPGTIQNCTSVSVQATGEQGGGALGSAGGIVGAAANSYILNCSVSGCTLSAPYTGEIVGWVNGVVISP